MRLSLSGRRLAALAAAFAVALQALWPLLSHARPQDPSLLVPLCTVEGVTHYLELKTGKTPLDERTALHGDHCQLCVFGADRHAAISSGHATPRAVSSCTDSTNFFHASPLPEPLSRSPAQPRAPPAVS